jgi:DNA-directed RNA polymerase specialized sigma24 family protein
VASVGEELEAAERRVLVGATLAELPEIFRVVFLRCELGEEAVSDVAADLGINPNTVHTRLRLARARFREALARQLAKLQAKPGDV